MIIFGFLSVSCTDLFKDLLPFDIEDYWRLYPSDDEDKELVKGKWILKKMGYEGLDDVGNQASAQMTFRRSVISNPFRLILKENT